MRTRAEVEADEKKAGSLVPTDKDEFKRMSAEGFLRRVYHHNEDFLGQGTKRK